MSSLTRDQQTKLYTANTRSAETTGALRYHISTESETESVADSDESGSNPANANTPSRFVNLVVLLPPLPQKGMFDVNTIKKSLYFFS